MRKVIRNKGENTTTFDDLDIGDFFCYDTGAGIFYVKRKVSDEEWEAITDKPEKHVDVYEDTRLRKLRPTFEEIK